MKKTIALVVLASACGASRSTHRGAPPAEPVGAAEPARPAETLRFEAGEALLADRGLRGTFVLRRRGEPGDLVAFPDLADEPFAPASTFKIPNSLIGLETGVVPGEGFTLPWDGEPRSIEAWNRDHDLASAMAESVVWYYQEVARRVGLERMRDWVARLGYGNAEVGAVVDAFWLEGPLAITAREQVGFLDRLTAGQLPVSDRSVEVLRRVMPSRRVGRATVLAKTGTALRAPSCHAWLVGWVETDGEPTASFALLLLCDPDEVPSRSMRWDLVESLLAAAG